MTDRFEQWLKHVGTSSPPDGLPRPGDFDTYVRPRIEAALQSERANSEEQDATADNTRLRRKGPKRWPSVAAAVAGVAIVTGGAGLAFYSAGPFRDGQSANHPGPTAAPPAHYPTFTPPSGETKIAQVTAPSEAARILVYASGIGKNSSLPSAPLSRTGIDWAPGPPVSGDAYVVGKESGHEVILAHQRLIEGTWIAPRWIGQNYAVLAAAVSPGDWTGLSLDAYDVTRGKPDSASGGTWKVKHVVHQGLNTNPVVGGIVMQRGNRLLVRSAFLASAGPAPFWYTFGPQGVTKTSVTTPYPDAASYPGATVFNLTVSHKQQAGSEPATPNTVVDIQASKTPLHLTPGSVFIVEEHTAGSNGWQPLGVDWSGAAAGDVQLLPSPYAFALVYKVRHAFQGKLQFSAHVFGPNSYIMHGTTEVPVTVR